MGAPRRGRWAVGAGLLALCVVGTARGQVITSQAGYIDGAMPANVFRVRFDATFDNRRPTRAEFIWAKSGDPTAPGPTAGEQRLDYQEFVVYAEMALKSRLSLFVNVPWRMVNPLVDDNAGGFADLDAGAKYALIYSQSLIATLQFRVYAPTGDAKLGLGTDHVSLEPSILAYKSLLPKLGLEGEFRYWVPVGGTDYSGQVLRYGLGLHYHLIQRQAWRLTPVVEAVGWTVLGGKKDVVFPDGSTVVEAAGGDTIINAKFGARVGIGSRADLYFGYGRALTYDRWFSDTLRAEFRYVY